MSCKGKNCNSNGKTPHSSECRFEYAANVASGVKGFTMPSRTTDHLAVLEELAKSMRTLAADIRQAGGGGCSNARATERERCADELDAAIALMRGRKNETPKECAWSWEDDYFAPMWKGSCGIAWQFTAGGPAGNECNFCPRCGGRIAISKDTADEQ